MQIIKLLYSSTADPFLDKYNRDIWDKIQGEAWRKARESTMDTLLTLVCHTYMAHIMSEVDEYAKRNRT